MKKKTCGPLIRCQRFFLYSVSVFISYLHLLKMEKMFLFLKKDLAESAWLRVHFFRLFLVTVICEFILSLFHSILIQFESINALIQRLKKMKNMYTYRILSILSRSMAVWRVNIVSIWFEWSYVFVVSMCCVVCSYQIQSASKWVRVQRTILVA